MTHRSWKQTIGGIAAAASLTIALGAGLMATTPAGAATNSKAVTTANLPGMGVILVDGQGHALYTHTDGNGKAVACTGACATAWPPLTVAAAKVKAPKGVKALATTGTTHQVTIGWPAALPVLGRCRGQAGQGRRRQWVRWNLARGDREGTDGQVEPHHQRRHRRRVVLTNRGA